ncbi:MAG TPA: serine/threonine protein kinase [Cyanobacteria bacterium UBA8543]|nr:serine/threonine protein kinase [Cyanobacteria bacterium UBA8543]
MECLHHPGEIIHQKYRIIDILGQGGVGITYEAEDMKSSQRVALKALSLRRTDDAKVLELFEREVQILAQLNHPAIPRYLDYFHINKRRKRFFYLAQQLAEGKSLAVLIEKGWQPDEAEVKLIATQLLEILVYLQQLTPPVIHRDIKPQNIIRCDDGRVFLVDFGAVQDVYHNTLTGGSTVAGTYGYMAPEQFRGRTVLATDLYALGATLISLLTQKSPTDLPHRNLKIDFRPHVRVTQQFADWLERMIEPVAEDRFLSAEEALAVLRGKQGFIRSATPKNRQVAERPVILMNDGNQLTVVIRPVWLDSAHSRIFALLPLVWNSILLLIIWITVVSGSLIVLTSIEFRFIPLVSQIGLLLLGIFGLVGFWILGTFLLSAASRTRLEIDRQNFQLQRRFLGWCYQKVQGRTHEISQVELRGIGLSMNKAPITVCTLKSRLRKHRFGSFLTESDKAWLVVQVKDFLEKQHTVEKSKTSKRSEV